MSTYKTIIARNNATTMIAVLEEDGGVYERITWDAGACESLDDAWESLADLEADGWQWQPYTLPRWRASRPRRSPRE